MGNRFPAVNQRLSDRLGLVELELQRCWTVVVDKRIVVHG